MSDLLSSSVRPGDLPEGRQGRHIGKMPVIIGVVIVAVVVGAMLYGGYIRMEKNQQVREGTPEETRSLSGTEFDDFLNQQGDGFIEPARTQRFETELGEGLTPDGSAANAAEEPELTELEKLYVEHERKQVENYLQAINSSTEAGGSGLSRLNQRQANTGSQTPSNEALSAFLSSGGQNQGIGALSAQLAALASQSSTASDPNLQTSKIDFLNQEVDSTAYLQHTRTDQITPFEIKTGTVIPGVMISGMNSDLPGQIIAQVREDVYDTATGRNMLIPQGTRLYGTYDSQVSYGQKRGLAVWTRLIYPDGSALDLGAMGGADQAGYSGFKDKVNNHYLRTFGSVLLLSLFNALPELVEDEPSSRSISNSNQITEVIPVTEQQFVGLDEDGEPIIVEVTREQVVTRTESSSSANSSGGSGDAFSDEFQAQLAQTTAQVATEVTRKNLQIQPTIIIRPGYKFNIMVNKDIAFEQPYTAYR